MSNKLLCLPISMSYNLKKSISLKSVVYTSSFLESKNLNSILLWTDIKNKAHYEVKQSHLSIKPQKFTRSDEHCIKCRIIIISFITVKLGSKHWGIFEEALVYFKKVLIKQRIWTFKCRQVYIERRHFSALLLFFNQVDIFLCCVLVKLEYVFVS